MNNSNKADTVVSPVSLKKGLCLLALLGLTSLSFAIQAGCSLCMDDDEPQQESALLDDTLNSN